MSKLATGCSACEFGQFQRTPTGLIRKGTAGRCTFKIPPPSGLPICATIPYMHISAIHADMGADCPTFKLKAE